MREQATPVVERLPLGIFAPAFAKHGLAVVTPDLDPSAGRQALVVEGHDFGLRAGGSLRTSRRLAIFFFLIFSTLLFSRRHRNVTRYVTRNAVTSITRKVGDLM